MSDDAAIFGDDDLDSIASEVVPREHPLGRVRKKDFAPWHKPRKQHVRNAWRINIENLLRRKKGPEEVNLFRYFTLPGADMLDIRYLEDTIKDAGFKIKYLGFDSTGAQSPDSDEFDLSISQNSLRSNTTWVERSSTMIMGPLESLVSGSEKDSVNLQAVKRHGPFDAINIDLCKSIVYSRGNSASAFDALAKLIHVQVQKSVQQWLLFVTTKVEKREVSERHLCAFMDAVRQNCNSSEVFDVQLDEFLNGKGSDKEVFLSDTYTLDPDSFKDAFSLGFAKWLICTLHEFGYEVSMKRSQYYSVGGREPDMLSLIFKCSRVEARFGDRFGLVSADPSKVPKEEHELGLSALEKVTDLEHLDALIVPGTHRWGQMVRETKDLLHKANYIDLAGYDEWAES